MQNPWKKCSKMYISRKDGFYSLPLVFFSTEGDCEAWGYENLAVNSSDTSGYDRWRGVSLATEKTGTIR